MPEVILPVLDEAAAVAGVLAALPHGYRAIVVDNGSTDGSGELAARSGAKVVSEPRRGFGAACHAGLEAAEQEIVCIMDCDGSLDPGELPALVALLESGEADLVLGRRRPTRGAWPLHARLANMALAALLRRRTGLAVARPRPDEGRAADTSCSDSALPTAPSAIRWRWSSAPAPRTGACASCRSSISRGPAARRSRGPCAAPSGRSAT